MLLLCYIFPPLAVIFMGRSWSALVTSFLMMTGWSKGVQHALVIYADREHRKINEKQLAAINAPAWTQSPNKSGPKDGGVFVDSPCIGANGTVFKKRKQ